MKVYEIKFTESGDTNDPFLNKIASETGHNSARHLLYVLNKWEWEVSTLKHMLTLPKYLKWLRIDK